MLDEEQQAAFEQSVAGVCQKALHHLSEHPGREAAVQFVVNVQRGVDRVVQQAAGDGPVLACREGCSYCCQARVEITPPQLWLMLRTIRQWPQNERDALRERLQTQVVVRARDPFARHDCALLQQQRCLVYEQRPATCRRAHSLEVAACARGDETLPQDMAIRFGAEALMRGADAAYQALGLDVAPRELGEALLVALDTPQAEQEWYVASGLQ
ncbi:YkgJ family cysteine cluster protein [Paludibacterium sp. B53371]|uniref:YkgJ family cysteine cluster protein n=1 Tax=Paludibacterium sp. B53371 TaxID=2806263 RepID=UPI001C054C74|nr:YkgJ family cysteine cluster protein [Paludibacterium sp. B53371]